MELNKVSNNVDIKLKEIFQKRFDINLDDNKYSPDDMNENLLKMKFGLKARNLLCLLFDIEKEFNINIQTDDIAAGKFNTYNNIIDIINKQLLQKVEEAV